MATQSDISKLMALMAVAWPRYELKAETIKVYASLLGDIQLEALEASAKHLMTESTFFPSIAEWRKAAFNLMIGGNAVPSPFEAWEEVMQQMRAVGSYRQPTFSHALIGRAVDVMGWKELCLSENNEYDRAHFFKVYDSLRGRAEQDIRMLPDVRNFAERAQLPENVTQSIKMLASKMGGDNG